MIRFDTTSTLRRLAMCLLVTGTVWRPAEAQALKQGASVRVQGTPASELAPGWHSGTIIMSGEGCAMILVRDPGKPRGQRALGLIYIQKLERQDGAQWVEVSVKPLIASEPKACREAVGG